MKYNPPKVQSNTVRTSKDNENILDSFFDFIKTPQYNLSFSNKMVLLKFADVFSFLSFGIVSSIILGFIISFVMQIIGYDTTQNSVVELFKEAPIYFFIFMALIWAPIFEEITFRLGMKFSPWKLALSLSFFIVVLFSSSLEFFPALATVLERFSERYSIVSVILSIVLLVVLLTLVVKIIIGRYVGEKKMKKLYRKNFVSIFYGMTLLFGAVHILNFKNFGEFWYVSFLLFLPQLSVSFILGYVRMRYGIIWSMLIHFFYNSFFTLPLVLISLLPASFLGDDLADNPDALEILSGNEQVMVSFVGIVIFLMFFMVSVAFFRMIFKYLQYKKNKY